MRLPHQIRGIERESTSPLAAGDEAGVFPAVLDEICRAFPETCSLR